jgi:AraC-like DNA-binding protein
MVRLDEGGCAARGVRLFRPRPSLRGWVQHVSVQAGPNRPGPWRVVADTCGHIILSATDAGVPRCRVVGARATAADIAVAGRAFTIAVRFHPGALPALIGTAASALTDRSVDLEDVTGSTGRRLVQEMAGMTPRQAAVRLEEALEVWLRGHEPGVLHEHLVRATRVDDWQRYAGVSARALHARVVAAVGLPPKRALRIERLHAALHAVAAGAGLSSAASAAGYSDQAHFTRESRALLFETPAAWLRRGRADSFKIER